MNGNPTAYLQNEGIVEIEDTYADRVFTVSTTDSRTVRFDLTNISGNVKSAYVKVYGASKNKVNGVVTLNGSDAHEIYTTGLYYHYDVTDRLKSTLGKNNDVEFEFTLSKGGAVTFNEERTRLCILFDTASVDVIADDISRYTDTVQAKINTTDTAYVEFPTRSLDALSDFTPRTTLDNRDLFAGNSKQSFMQTGKYYITKKANGRYTMVNPLGKEYYGIGLSNVSQGTTAEELSAIYAKYPTLSEENAVKQWGLDTADALKNQLGFTEVGWSSYNKLTTASNVKKNISQIITFNLMTEYLKTKIAEDSSLAFSADKNSLTLGSDTLYIFNPDFEEFCDTYFSALRISMPEEKYIIALSSDNELPSTHKMLDKYLALDHTQELNRYSYEVASEWFMNYAGINKVNTAYITDIMREDFKEFVYDRYYSVVSKSMKKYFPNTLYFGIRNKYSGYESSGIMKATGRYCDAVSINYYKVWTPDSYTLAEIAGWSKKPFIVTEFYAKGADSGLGNADGWGWICPTQSDRAAFYQNYALKLLECKDCIGFNWFKYRDDVDSNKGLYKMNLEIYPELSESVKEITYNIYDLIDYFDGK